MSLENLCPTEKHKKFMSWLDNKIPKYTACQKIEQCIIVAYSHLLVKIMQEKSKKKERMRYL